MQDAGARVVAIDRLLDLLFHRHRDVFREVGWNPFRPVRGSGDDELVLVFRKQRSIEEVHGDLRLSCVRISELKIFSTACRRRCRSSEERGGGEVCVSTCRYWWSAVHSKTKTDDS